MSFIKNQPIVILGGFLISKESYGIMSKILQEEINQPVEVIDVSKYDWLITNWSYGWKRILDKLDKVVKELQKTSKTGKVTLIGHSSGGVMLRMYLGDKEFSGKNYNGKSISNLLITLGSPHQAIRGTKLRLLVDKLYPGSYYKNNITYISVAGKINLNDNSVSNLSRKTAKKSYQSLTSKENEDGDGIVPLKSALLNGSNHIIMEDTSHSGIFGKNWYCSESKVFELIEKLSEIDLAS
mgnify:CR=1 FL=1|tara:strand:- start:39417 stop:40133 length:717 start_codon:yes stop_codon:yes gene_type:complete